MPVDSFREECDVKPDGRFKVARITSGHAGNLVETVGERVAVNVQGLGRHRRR